jgi:NADH-quinone oxidoreductase subunit F
MERVLTKYFHLPDYHRITTYMEHGGYGGLTKAFTLSPEEIIEEVKKSGLRGRGGAGFPTGVKWGFMPKEQEEPSYLVINADEGEPGTFKDRYLMEKGPHLLIEGIIISSYALASHLCFVYIRGEFVRAGHILAEAVEEAYREGFLGKDILSSGFDLDVILHRGAGAYICGEETALIESLEGKLGKPRLKPPFPAQYGLFGSPTTVNNVETIADIPYIIEKGGEAFLSLGTEKDGGTRLYGLSGYVNNPGIYELPSGTNLKEIINTHGGGVMGGRELKAVIPGGSSVPVLTADEIDIPADIDSLAGAGSMIGTGGIIVIPQGVCMVRALEIIMSFYAHESCGKCTPCREGTEWMRILLHQIENGNGTGEDLELLLDICDNMEGMTICALADAAVMPAVSFIEKFRHEFDYHIEHGTCMENEISI